MVDLPWDTLVTRGGLGGLITAGVWMIMTGRLVPRYFYKQKVDESEAWKAAAKESAAQVVQLLEYARTADAILKSLPRGGNQSEVD